MQRILISGFPYLALYLASQRALSGRSRGKRKSQAWNWVPSSPSVRCWLFTDLGETFHPLWILLPHLRNAGKSIFPLNCRKDQKGCNGSESILEEKQSPAQVGSLAVGGVHHAGAPLEQGRESAVVWLQKRNLRCRSSGTAFVAHLFIRVVNIYGHLLCFRHHPRRWGCRDESTHEELERRGVAWQTDAGWCQVLWEHTEGSCLVGSDGEDVGGCCRILPSGPPMVLSRL